MTLHKHSSFKTYQAFSLPWDKDIEVKSMMFSRLFHSFIHSFTPTTDALGEQKSISQSLCPWKAQKLMSGRQNKIILALIKVDKDCS